MDMVCPTCKKQIDDAANFCQYCGSKVLIEIVCPHCGASPLPKDSKFCPDCGNPLRTDEDVVNTVLQSRSMQEIHIFQKESHTNSEKSSSHKDTEVKTQYLDHTQKLHKMVEDMIKQFSFGYQYYVEKGNFRPYNPYISNRDCKRLLARKGKIEDYESLHKEVARLMKLYGKEYGKLIKKEGYPPFSRKLSPEQLKQIINRWPFDR